MFKKELVDVLKQTAWFVAAICTPPGLLILSKAVSGPYSEVFALTLQAGLAFFSVFLGASLFGRERGKGPWIRPVPFPYSRFGPSARLAGPRLIVLTALLIAAWAGLAAAGFREAAASIPGLAGIVGLPFFLIALSLSVLIENFIVLCVASLAAWDAVLTLIYRLLWGFGHRSLDTAIPGMFAFSRSHWDDLPPERSIPLVVLQLVLPVVPFIAGLLLSIGRFDVRRSARFVRRYLLVLGSGLAACALIAFSGGVVARSHAFKDYYLTKDLKLIEWSYASDSVRGRVLGEGDEAYDKDGLESLVELGRRRLPVFSGILFG